jgi:ubiquinone/menaquinone biosynthesis C-methylase UbiE
MEDRKQKEREFSEKFRENHAGAAMGNQKFYSVTRGSRDFFKEWLRQRCSGRKVLDYGCGDGMFTVWLAEQGADATGVDISGVSFPDAQKVADEKGVGSRVHFFEMDCEHMSFPDESFDFVMEGGVLHHLDLAAALAELARVVKRDGAVICGEAVADNPLVHLYRKKTPQMRTAWEVDHILHVRDLKVAKRYFEKVDVRFFHLFTILAVPFRNTFLFKPVLSLMEAIDSVFLKLPGIRTQAWQMIFILSKPKQTATEQAT